MWPSVTIYLQSFKPCAKGDKFKHQAVLPGHDLHSGNKQHAECSTYFLVVWVRNPWWWGGSFSPTYGNWCVWRRPLSHLGWMSWQMRAWIDGKQLKGKKKARGKADAWLVSHTVLGLKSYDCDPECSMRPTLMWPRSWRREKCTGGTWKWELGVHIGLSLSLLAFSHAFMRCL